MSKPDDISTNYNLVHFYGKNFREIMVKLLNWMDEPAGGTYKRADGTIGHLEYTNDFYCLHDTIHVLYDSEYSSYSVDILMGEVPHAEEDQR